MFRHGVMRVSTSTALTTTSSATIANFNLLSFPLAATLNSSSSILINRFHHRRSKCSISDNILSTSGTGGFDLTFLGTSSQGGARRYPSSLALRLRGTCSSQVWLFDAGEGATAQLQRSNMRLGLVRNLFITHMHGDHLFGLPGLVMCILGRRDELSSRLVSEDGTLHIYGPQGIRAFLRTALGVASFRVPATQVLFIHELVWPYGCGPSAQRGRHRRARPYWRRNVRRLSFEGVGRDIEPERIHDKYNNGQWTYRLIDENGHTEQQSSSTSTTSSGSSPTTPTSTERNVISEKPPATVLAAPVLHTVPTFAYSITENVASRRFDKTKLGELGIPKDGRDEVRQLFSSWLSGERGIWKGQEIDVESVLQCGRQARKLCVIGDTYDATPAAHIAENSDVIIHEATNVAAQTDMARRRGHSSTSGATQFAKRVNAKRLILNHTSVAYSERKIRALENEARAMLGSKKVFVARDLSVFSVPTAEEDGDDYVFRRFKGFADCIEYKNMSGGGGSTGSAGAGVIGIGDRENSPFSSDFSVGREQEEDDNDEQEEEEMEHEEEDDKSDGDMSDDGGEEEDEDEEDDEEDDDEDDDDDGDDDDDDEEEDKVKVGEWRRNKKEKRKEGDRSNVGVGVGVSRKASKTNGSNSGGRRHHNRLGDMRVAVRAPSRINANRETMR